MHVSSKGTDTIPSSSRKETTFGSGILFGSFIYPTEISRHLQECGLLKGESVSLRGRRSAKPHLLLQAFSAYYYVMDFLNLTLEETTSQEKVIDTMEKFCSQPWEEVSDETQQLFRIALRPWGHKGCDSALQVLLTGRRPANMLKKPRGRARLAVSASAFLDN